MSNDLASLSNIYSLAAQLNAAGGQTVSGRSTASSDPEAAQLQVQQNFNKILSSFMADMSDNGSSDDYIWSSLLTGTQSAAGSGTISSTGAEEQDPEAAILQIRQSTNLMMSNFLDALFQDDEEEKDGEDIWGSLLSYDQQKYSQLTSGLLT